LTAYSLPKSKRNDLYDIEKIDLEDKVKMIEDEYDESIEEETPTFHFVVGETEMGERIDKFLNNKISDQSRTYFGDLCDEERVRVDGRVTRKAHRVLKGENVLVFMTQNVPETIMPEKIDLKIIYEDSDILAISKPPGMVVHPAPGNWNGTFANGLLNHLNENERNDWSKENNMRPGIVHRIDKGTSGVLLAAKNPIIQKKLSQMFQERSIEKTYLAICAGNPRDAQISVPIGRHPTNRQKMVAIDKDQPEVRSRNALSHVKTMAFDGGLSVIEVKIVTGRTHQIRVHMQHNKTPIIGDSLYGNNDWNRRMLKRGIDRPMLHAFQLKFSHPLTSIETEITAPLPNDMAKIVCSIFPSAPYKFPTWFDDIMANDESFGVSKSESLMKEAGLELTDWY